MRRVHTAAWVMLGAGAAAAALWAWSGGRCAEFRGGVGAWSLVGLIERGNVVFFANQWRPIGVTSDNLGLSMELMPRWAWERPSVSCSRSSLDVVMPLWLVAVGAMGASAMLWRVGRSTREGRCGRCGYDLAGNVSGVCPECGVTPSLASGE